MLYSLLRTLLSFLIPVRGICGAFIQRYTLKTQRSIKKEYDANDSEASSNNPDYLLYVIALRFRDRNF